MEKHDKILVTGGTGFIGSYILRELVQRGYQNIHALRRENSSMELVKPFKNAIVWHTAEIEDVDQIYSLIRGSITVIHAAALVSFAPGDRERLYEINVQGTETIVNACLYHGVNRLIHISSTGALAKNKDGKPINEKTKWIDDKHTSQYGRSKHQAEMEVWRGMAEGLSAIILNPSIVLGAGDWSSSSCKLFMKIHDGLKFHTPGRTGFVDVRDVARISTDMITHDTVNESYILSGENLYFKDVFDKMAQGLGKKPPSLPAPKWIAKSLVAIETIKTMITRGEPLLTSDSVRSAYKNFSYDNQKIKALDYRFIPIQQTIQETTQLLKAAVKNDFRPTLLPPNTNVHSTPSQ